MKNNILLKTNLLVSVILLVGFALIATLSYRANYNASLVKIKQVSSLASEGIYYRLSTMLTKPVNISQTMAHDSLLIKLLEEEGSRYQEAGYQETIRKYLDTYKISMPMIRCSWFRRPPIIIIISTVWTAILPGARMKTSGIIIFCKAAKNTALISIMMKLLVRPIRSLCL